MVGNLKMLREEKGVSQEKFGAMFNLSQQSIYKYETHGIEPDITTLIKMADYFDVSVDFLIGNTDIRRRFEETVPSDLNAGEANLVSQYRRLSKENRRLISSMIEALLHN